mmetsp:Transcript_20425/g.38089  ORF Transcript_20425/g.38089 Transcript_20425/m.38089 type:complete len:363 (+) Transcript_20425:123-1211(+)
MSSTVTPLASSMSVNPPFFLSHLNTHMSVMIKSTTPLPVRGKEQSLIIFFVPSFATCSMVTTTREPGAPTRSIAPPIPLTIFPGIIQFARSPFEETCMPPRIVRPTLQDRIIPKESEELNVEAPGTGVTVCFPALIQSASAEPFLGKGPIPISPFSDWSSMRTPEGRKLDAMVGIPIPKLTYMPSLNSLAARRTILPRPPVTTLPDPPDPSSARSVTCSMRFSLSVAFTTRSTKTPGRWTSSGEISPASTISSTSAMQKRPARAQSGLKLRAVPRKTRLPLVSAFHALTRETSPVMASSMTYSTPLKVLVSLGSDLISTSPDPSLLYLMGKPPSAMTVPAAVGVKNAGIPAPPERRRSANVP